MDPVRPVVRRGAALTRAQWVYAEPSVLTNHHAISKLLKRRVCKRQNLGQRQIVFATDRFNDLDTGGLVELRAALLLHRAFHPTIGFRDLHLQLSVCGQGQGQQSNFQHVHSPSNRGRSAPCASLIAT